MNSCRVYINKLTDDPKVQARLEDIHNSIFKQLHDSKLFRQYNGYTFLPNADASGRYMRSKAFLQKINEEHKVPVVGTAFTKTTGREYAFVNVKNYLGRLTPTQGSLFQLTDYPRRLTFLRHGVTPEDTKGLNSGQNDVPLNAEGKRLSKLEGERLKEQGVTKLFTSPAKRAIETAEATTIPHETIDKLNAWNLGEFESKPESAFDERFYVKNSSIQVPGGESFDDFVSRTSEAIDEISKDGADNYAILTHSKTLKLIQALQNNNGEYNEKTKEDFLKEESPSNSQIEDIYWHNPNALQESLADSTPIEANEVTLSKFREWAKRAGLTGLYTKDIEVNGKKFNGIGVAYLAQNLYNVVKGYERVAEPEEIMHFAVQAIKETDPELYKKMAEEVTKYAIYQATLKDYSKVHVNEDGTPDMNKITDEAITKALTETVIRREEGITSPDMMASKSYEPTTKNWWERIKEWFMGLIGKAGFNPFEKAASEILKGNTFDNEMARLHRGDAVLYSTTGELKKSVHDVIDDIREDLYRQMRIYESRGKKEVIKDLADLLDKIQTLDETDALATYISEAYEYTMSAGKRIEAIAADDYSTGSISALRNIYDYIQSYNLLDEIKNLDEYKKLGVKRDESIPNTVMDKLHDAIVQRDTIKRDYKNKVIPRLAKVLHDNIGPDLSQKFSEEDLEKELLAASQDESVWRALLDPLVSSAHPVLGAFGRLTARMIHRAEQASLEFDARARDALKKFYDESGRKGISNASKLFEGLSELRTIVRKQEQLDEHGEKTGVFQEKSFTERYFVEETDHNAFNKAKYEFIRSLDDRLKDKNINQLQYATLLSKWYKENTEKIPNADEIIKEKQDTSTKAAFEIWQERNNPLSYDGTHREYRYQLSRPKASKYQSEAYKQMLATPGLKAFYDFVTGEHLKAQESWAEGRRLGMRFPSVLKSIQDIFIEDGAKAAASEAVRRGFNWTEADIERGIQNQAGEQVQYIPMNYTQHMSADKVSNDVFANLKKLVYMSNRYTEFEKNIGVAEALKDVMQDNRPFKTNLKGEKIKDALANKIGIDKYLKKEYGDSNLYSHLKNFIDMIYYGEMKAKGTMISVFGKEISVDKTLDSMARLTALDMLAGNLTQGFNLATLLSTMRISEAMGGQFYNARDWGTAEGKFYTILNQVMGDVGKQSQQLSMWGQIIQKYDPIQGSFKHHTLGTVTGSQAKRLFASEPSFMVQHLASYQAQIKGMLAMMNHQQVEQVEDGIVKKIKLIDAYTVDEKGVLKLKDGVKWNDDDTFNLKEKLHSITRGLHGANDDLSKATAHRFAILRLALLFRNWVVPGFRRRFDPKHPDFEKDAIIEGNHRAFFRLIVQDIKNKRMDLLFNWKNMSDIDKQNVRRSITELGFVVATTLVVGVLAHHRDDEDKKHPWAADFLLYQAKRLQTELLFYTDPLDAWKILKSPTAAMTMVENTALLLDNALPWNIGDEYQTANRQHQKGDLKIYSRLKKVLPIINHLENLKNPDEAFNWFKSGNL